jgi:transposase
VEEKRRIVEQTLEAGASMARVARAHGVNANQVFSWRQYQQGRLERGTSETLGLLPVRVVEAATREAAGSRSAQTHRASSGLIHTEFPKGHLHITERVDLEALRVVLEKLLG